MIINSNDEKIRYTGRWNVTEAGAESTCNGSYFEFAFAGECAVIGFDVSGCRVPVPRIYISVDGGAYVEAMVERYIRISAEDGEHSVQVIMKGSVETQQRWFAPLEAYVRLAEIEADVFLPLKPDNRKIIEFIGDSITEGIAIDACRNGTEEAYRHYGDGDMVFWDDSTAGYAWRTAKALDMRPVIMGYGCLGVTREGAGNIPPMPQSYPFYSDGAPIKEYNADFIVINHGTNDCNAEKSLFKEKYKEALSVLRKNNPSAKIISLTPFSGTKAGEIEESVAEYNSESGDSVFYINSTGWIAKEPLHPNRSGHKTVAKHLAAIIKEKYML